MTQGLNLEVLPYRIALARLWHQDQHCKIVLRCQNSHNTAQYHTNELQVYATFSVSIALYVFLALGSYLEYTGTTLVLRTPKKSGVEFENEEEHY